MTQQLLSADELSQAKQLISDWPQWSISRYNSYRPTFAITEPYVLVICANPKSLPLLVAKAVALADAASLPQNLLMVSDHDGGLLDLPSALMASLRALASDFSLQELVSPSHHAVILKHASLVITDESWLGFEALLWGKQVVVTGKPFYAGLGLTTDDADLNCDLVMSLPQLVAFTLIRHTVSVDIATGTAIPITQALAWLGWQNQQRWRYPALLYAVGFNLHWRAIVQAFFAGSTLKFVKTCEQVPAGEAAVIWGMQQREHAQAHISSLFRLEDGFIRSVGLGALFAKPLSWIADSRGLYFDATQPSDLEHLLAHRRFSQQELQRAAALREWLCANKVSKYNTGTLAWQRPVTEKTVILVAGQVETDASIAFGAPSIRQNIELLAAVRTRHPAAHIIYKPHPDVVAGARALGNNEQLASVYCDQIETQVDISVMLEQVDEVHVLTSLAGFEALLRGNKVVCYGMPFYAGWGLTQDVVACERRTRRLTTDELVAGCLMAYPMYLDPQTGFYTNALDAAKTLAQLREQSNPLRALWRRLLRFSINLVRGKQ